MAKLVSFFLAILLSFWLTLGAPRPSTLELPSQPLALTTDLVVVNPQSTVSASYVRVHAFKTVFFHVGDASLEHFGLSRQDFEYLRSIGVTAIEGDFDSCARDEDVKYLLDESASVRMGVILPAQIRTSEGSTECANLVQQSEAQGETAATQSVVSWVQQWKSHPAVIAWDTTDPQLVYTASQAASLDKSLQLEVAYASVKAIDPTHPVLVSLQQPIDASNSSIMPLSLKDLPVPFADIVVVQRSQPLSEIVSQVATLQSGDQQPVKVLIGVGGVRTHEGWVFPEATTLQQELSTLRESPAIMGVGFYKYGAKESTWYLPYHKPELLPVFQN